MQLTQLSHERNFSTRCSEVCNFLVKLFCLIILFLIEANVKASETENILQKFFVLNNFLLTFFVAIF